MTKIVKQQANDKAVLNVVIKNACPLTNHGIETEFKSCCHHDFIENTIERHPSKVDLMYGKVNRK